VVRFKIRAMWFVDGLTGRWARMTGRHTDRVGLPSGDIDQQVTLRFDVSGYKALGHPLGTDGTGVEHNNDVQATR